MAQMEQSIWRQELESMLQIDNKGWNVTLFQDQNSMSFILCSNCDAVCCDAVELGCSHDDIDIHSYCNNCLQQLIQNNQQLCPINSHSNPIIIPSRALRMQILKTLVSCPYENNGNSACQWKGTLNDLLTAHLKQCISKYDSSFAYRVKIKQLQHELQSLNNIINAQKKTINHQNIRINILEHENKVSKYIEIKEDNNKQICSSDKAPAFHIDHSVTDSLGITDYGKTLFFRGKYGLYSNYIYRSICGTCYKQNDKITMYLELFIPGYRENYSFGFVSNYFEQWKVKTRTNEGHIMDGFCVNGQGFIHYGGAFSAINTNYKKNELCPVYKNFLHEIKTNIIGISIDMNKKIGCIWNEAEKDGILIVNLPDTAKIMIGFGGTNKKSVTIKRYI
eukprot:498473_1